MLTLAGQGNQARNWTILSPSNGTLTEGGLSLSIMKTWTKMS